jgi:hypothetical protein
MHRLIIILTAIAFILSSATVASATGKRGARRDPCEKKNAPRWCQNDTAPTNFESASIIPGERSTAGVSAAGVLGDGSAASASTATQLGILDNDNDITNEQSQTSVGSVDSHDSVTVEGDNVNYDAPDIPVNSAAPVFAGACSQGVSVQTQSFGGSAGSSNPVCDYVAVAGGFIASGNGEAANLALQKAEKAADWRYRLSQIRSILTLGLL